MVGHDIGGPVSVPTRPPTGTVRRLTVVELPQIDESLTIPVRDPGRPRLRNLGFLMLGNGLPERIVSGGEDTWIAGFADWLEVVKGALDPR